MNTVNQLQHTPIDTAIYEKFVCYNHKTTYTDWCPIPNDGGWGICLRMRNRYNGVAVYHTVKTSTLRITDR